jgi:hypothetical protein
MRSGFEKLDVHNLTPRYLDKPKADALSQRFEAGG